MALWFVPFVLKGTNAHGIESKKSSSEWAYARHCNGQCGSMASLKVAPGTDPVLIVFLLNAAWVSPGRIALQSATPR